MVRNVLKKKSLRNALPRKSTKCNLQPLKCAASSYSFIKKYYQIAGLKSL